MDIGKAFSYIAEDEKWVEKLGIGALIGMIPFINFAVFGYQVQIARNVWQGEKRPLPTWNDFGKLFVDGLRLIGALMVYMLPLILIYGVMAGGIISFSFMAESGAYAPTGSNGDEFLGIMMLMMSFSALCIMPYMLFVWILYPMFFIQIARHGSLKSCFAFREMWALLKAQPANYLLIIAIFFGLTTVISFAVMPLYFVTMFIPCIGFLIMMLITGGMTILVGAVSGHLEGQFIRDGDDDIALSGIEKDPI